MGVCVWGGAPLCLLLPSGLRDDYGHAKVLMSVVLGATNEAGLAAGGGAASGGRWTQRACVSQLIVPEWRGRGGACWERVVCMVDNPVWESTRSRSTMRDCSLHGIIMYNIYVSRHNTDTTASTPAYCPFFPAASLQHAFVGQPAH